jgi:hypothetical protein
MTIAPSLPIARILGTSDDESPAAFMQFFGEVCSIPAVRMFGVADDGTGPLQVWVRLRVDDEEQEERVYVALQGYRRSASPPIDLRVVLAAQSESAFPEDAAILFRRQ